MTSPPEPEPMQLGFTHLSTEERERRMRQNLCLYCGLPGHLRASCPTRPPRNPPSVSKTSTISSILEIPVTLRVNGEVIETSALIDSGAAGNIQLTLLSLRLTEFPWRWMLPVLGLVRFSPNDMVILPNYTLVLFTHANSPPRNRIMMWAIRELLAMKAAFEEWRHWLEGAKHPFTVLTDHRNLEYLRSAKRLNHRPARWALFFTRFDFSVTYRPGTQNTKADALSRLHKSSIIPPNHESIISPTVILAPIQWDIMSEIAEAQATDPPPAETPPNCTYVPLALRQRVIQWVHSTLSSGHPGIAATVQLLTNHFWWSTLQADTINHIRQCPTCNVSKPSHQLPAGLLQHLPILQRPWSHIAIDFITDLPLSGGHTTILTVIDRFSKACHFIPLPKLPTALETAEILCNYVFRFYGLPEDIVSD